MVKKFFGDEWGLSLGRAASRETGSGSQGKTRPEMPIARKGASRSAVRPAARTPRSGIGRGLCVLILVSLEPALDRLQFRGDPLELQRQGVAFRVAAH